MKSRLRQSSNYITVKVHNYIRFCGGFLYVYLSLYIPEAIEISCRASKVSAMFCGIAATKIIPEFVKQYQN